MKSSSWFLAGVGAAFLAGLIFVIVGFFRPGQVVLPESAGGAGKSLLLEAKKQAEAVQKTRKQAAAELQKISALTGDEGEHRVFVSAQLVYLPGDAEPVRPLDRKMKTEDGIAVGWKIQHGFDPADPNVKDEDPDGDGFTNLEEFVAQPPTNPNNKEDSPAKESKLKSRSGDPVSMALSFPEKSGGLYTVRFQVGAKRREFKGKPGDSLWVMAGPDGVEVFSDEAKMSAARGRAREAGQNQHVIPLKFVSYEEKVEKMKDVKAGGVEVEVDNSVMVLERKDALESRLNLIFSTPQRPQAVTWDVGDVRFYSPAGGGTEIGPFRVGETFSFEGKEFSVVARDGKKIQLRNRSEAGKPDLWVPPEATGSAPALSAP